MKRAILGSYLLSILLSPDAAEGGGGLAATMTGEAELDSAVMGKLGLQMEEPTASGRKAEGGGQKAETKAAAETPEQKAEREAGEAKIAEFLSENAGKTREEAIATIDAEAQAEARQVKINELIEAGKTAEEAEALVAAEDEKEQENEEEVQAPELTEEVKTWHEQQVAAKDQEISDLTTKLQEAEAKATDLEGQLQSAGQQPLAIAPIDPLFLIDDPAQLDAEANRLRSFEAWLLKNWDGTPAVEADAAKGIKAQPAYTAEQIRERYAQVKQLREEILPAAKDGIKARQAHETQARKVYPELFDAKRPESKVAANLLKLAPGLKAVIPNIHIVIGDALRGERARLAEEKARAAKGKAGGQKPAGGVKPAPKVIKASGGTSNIQHPTSNIQGKKSAQVVDAQKFSKMMEAGNTGREALVAALSS